MASNEGQYHITNVDQLIESAGNLATYRTNLLNNVDSLNYIKNSVTTNWQNDDAYSDVKSYVEELQACIDKLNNTIIPTIQKFSSTMYNLAIANKEIESNTVNGSK